MAEKWYNLSENKRIIFKISIVLILIIISTIILVLGAGKKNPAPAEYTIFVYPDGMAKINVDNVNTIIQTQEDLKIKGVMYKAGTIILPGNGIESEYEYTRQDQVLN